MPGKDRGFAPSTPPAPEAKDSKGTGYKEGTKAMKTTVSILAASAMLAAPAFAGSIDKTPPDPVVQTPAPAAPLGPDWTGFYAGGQLGYANIGTNAAGVDGEGVTGGVTLGYDYDFGDVVVGGGIDYDMGDIDLTPAVSVENVFRAKLRGGVKVGNGLSYVTGGYAQADTNALGSEDGYFVGVGYEHMVTENVSVGFEGLFHEFDNFNGTALDVDARTLNVRGTFRF